ncbi:MAG: inositol monophosphatase family protein [Candidatus Thermoplasmatota archaeon]
MKDLLHEIADAVQAAIRERIDDPSEVVGMGADGTPTQKIDAIAEQAVFRLLESRGLHYTVVSEEAGRVEAEGDWTLVLDPIDGTHNAIRGVPAYAVSVAACRRAPTGKRERLSDVTSGLVRDLVNGHTYYAERDGGATLNGQPIRVRRPYRPNDTVFDVYLGEKAHPRGSDVARIARRVRNLGAASLDLCLVARGAVDLYYLHSAEVGHELRAMDIAAGTLVVREAGGNVVDLDGRPLDMPIDPKARSNVIAYGDEHVLELIR